MKKNNSYRWWNEIFFSLFLSFSLSWQPKSYFLPHCRRSVKFNDFIAFIYNQLLVYESSIVERGCSFIHSIIIHWPNNDIQHMKLILSIWSQWNPYARIQKPFSGFLYHQKSSHRYLHKKNVYWFSFLHCSIIVLVEKASKNSGGFELWK